MKDLSRIITRLAYRVQEKLVLFIDEVDASSNYEPFLKLLALFRTKYLDRGQFSERTFHSIVLVGVHDIKSLKFKLRNPEDAQFNSPWNIAVDFEVSMSFTPPEILPMLTEFAAAENVEMDAPAVAERLYYHTSGYPFLVSKLCKNIAEKRVPESDWTPAGVDAAVRGLLTENNTNFDSLFKNLENHPDLRDLVERVLIEGENIPFNPHNPTLHKGIIYGIFQRGGTTRIHNRIYEQLIYNYLESTLLTQRRTPGNFAYHFTTDDDGLDLPAILLKFQQFMREQHSEKSLDFLEREGRTVFLAYLAPILNGRGYAFREVQTSVEKRLDVIITYGQHRYIIELKKWYGQKYHERGLEQLADYLEIHGVSEGYLLIFDARQNKEWRSETMEVAGKRIFGVWV